MLTPDPRSRTSFKLTNTLTHTHTLWFSLILFKSSQTFLELKYKNLDCARCNRSVNNGRMGQQSGKKEKKRPKNIFINNRRVRSKRERERENSGSIHPFIVGNKKVSICTRWGSRVGRRCNRSLTEPFVYTPRFTHRHNTKTCCFL